MLAFSQLYSHNIGASRTLRKPGSSVLAKAKKALQQAGIKENDIRNIISHDQPVPVATMKDIAAILNKSKVYGFDKNQSTSITRLLNKERIKAQSIAEVRKEHILEAMEENLPATGAASLSGRGVSPNKERVKAVGTAVFSLNRIKSSKPASSLSATGKGVPRGTKSPNGSFLKPKY